MADWTRQAGLPKDYTLHGLRRTFGAHLAECNVQTRILMDAMGHSHFSSTEKYIRDANRKQNMILVAQTINAREEKRDTNRRWENIRVVK
jgi:integrase